MGLYDDAPRIGIPPIYVAAILLLLLDVYLLLPPLVGVSTRLSEDVLKPGGGAVLWVSVKNNSFHPLSGVYVRAESLSPWVEVNYASFLPTIPPLGDTVVGVTVYVKAEAIPGSHMLRVFVSYPERTEVTNVRVVVG